MSLEEFIKLLYPVHFTTASTTVADASSVCFVTYFNCFYSIIFIIIRLIKSMIRNSFSIGDFLLLIFFLIS